MMETQLKYIVTAILGIFFIIFSILLIKEIGIFGSLVGGLLILSLTITVLSKISTGSL